MTHVWARWRPRLQILRAAAVSACIASALPALVPDRKTVSLQRDAMAALHRGAYATADHRFNEVLAREPRAMHARVGLACSFAAQGHRARAVLEVNLALRDGLVLASQSDCPRVRGLSTWLVAAKLSLTDSFAVPRDPSRTKLTAELLTIPRHDPSDRAYRLLIGACLAFRAGMTGLGWYYAANAHDTGDIDRKTIGVLRLCLGARTLTRLGCSRASDLLMCVLDDRQRAAYLRDRPYIYPVD